MSFLLSQETNAWSIDKKITSYLFPFFPSLGYCVIGLLRLYTQNAAARNISQIIYNYLHESLF